jgi:hypothetical protein
MITGPLAYIFAGVVVSTISHGIDLNADIKEDSDDYRKIRPLYIVQLVVIISLLVMSPINYLVAKATVKEEHEEHEDEDDIDYTAYKPEEWKIDINKPKVFDYADEFFFKPRFIRSYHSRKKCLGVIKHAFEMSALLYEHSHDDHHDDHGHSDHDSHGHGSHGHSHGDSHHNHTDDHHEDTNKAHIELNKSEEGSFDMTGASSEDQGSKPTEIDMSGTNPNKGENNPMDITVSQDSLIGDDDNRPSISPTPIVGPLKFAKNSLAMPKPEEHFNTPRRDLNDSLMDELDMTY